MQSLTSGEIGGTQPGKIKAVVDITSVGGTSSLLHHVLVTQQSQMIGNEILRLVQQTDQFLDAVVTLSQQRKQFPAYLMSEQLEKVRWFSKGNVHLNLSKFYQSILMQSILIE